MKQKQVAVAEKAVKKAVVVPMMDKADPNTGATRIVATEKKARYVDFSSYLDNYKIQTKILERIADKTPKGEFFKETVNKASALDILTRNKDNRKLKRQSIDKYVDDLQHGNFEWNGETIKFDKNGRLIDGQHRLWAIVLADAKVPCLIVCGLEPKVQATIDNGQNRNASDALHFHGYIDHPSIVAAVIKAYEQWNRTHTVHSRNHRYVFSPADVLNWALEHENEAKKINEFAEFSVKTLFKDAPFFKASQWAFLYFLLWSLPGRQGKAKDFITKMALNSGISEDEHSAIFYGRRMIARLDKDTEGNSHYIYTLKVKLLVKAWNLWIEGKERATEKSFRWMAGEKDNTVIEKPI